MVCISQALRKISERSLMMSLITQMSLKRTLKSRAYKICEEKRCAKVCMRKTKRGLPST